VNEHGGHRWRYCGTRCTGMPIVQGGVLGLGRGMREENVRQHHQSAYYWMFRGDWAMRGSLDLMHIGPK
jgi:hypothetical protein